MLQFWKDSKGRKSARIAHFPIPHAFSTNDWGGLSLRRAINKEKTLSTRTEFILAAKAPQKILYLEPGNKRVVVASHFVPSIAADAVISKEPMALGILPGDCFPIVIAGLQKEKLKILSLVHAGFLASSSHIVRRTIRVMASLLKTDEMMMGIGPGIQSCCYRKKLCSLINWDQEEWKPYMTQRRSHSAHFDLLRFNYNEAQKEGVKKIFLANVCTCCGMKGGEFLFPSHRRSFLLGEKDSRFLTVVWWPGS